MGNLAVEFTFAEEDPQTVAAALAEEGASEVDEITDAGILPVVALVVVAVIAMDGLVNVVLRLLRVWKCGMTIDTRGNTVRTEKNCDLPRGSVTIISDKKTTVTVKEPSDLKTNLQDAIKLARG